MDVLQTMRAVGDAVLLAGLTGNLGVGDPEFPGDVARSYLDLLGMNMATLDCVLAMNPAEGVAAYVRTW